MSAFQLNRDGHMAFVDLKSDAENTLTTADFVQLRQIFDQLEQESEEQRAHVILLRSGQDQVFSKGISPRFLVESSLKERREVFAELINLLERTANLGIPLVADINGPALAGGAVLAALADFTIAHEDQAKLCFSEVKVGIPVPEPIFELLSLRIPRSACRNLLVLGKNVLARDLVALGFTQGVYRSEQDHQYELEKLIGRILRIEPRVIAATLRASKAGLQSSCQAFARDFDQKFVPFLEDDRAVQSLRALLAK